MTLTSQNREAETAGAASKTRVPRSPWAVLSSMRFALALVAVLVAACITGTVLPQGDAVASYVRQHPDAAPRLGLLRVLGLTDVFHSAWFIGLLGLLALSLVSCGITQALALSRATCKGRAVSSLLIHLSLVAILAGGLIRGVWGQKGSLQLHTGEFTAEFESTAGSVPLPFDVRLLRFDVERDGAAAGAAQPQDDGERLQILWAGGATSSLPVTVGAEQVVPPGDAAAAARGTFTVRILRAIPDFMMDPVSHVVETRSAQPRNPAIQVAVAGPGCATTNWLFAKYPAVTMPMRQGDDAPFRMVYERRGQGSAAGPVRNYRSTLEFAENGQAVKQASLAVNAPLSYRGYTFYQSGYDPGDTSWTSLLVVRDPGVPLVFTGFGGLLIGLFMGLYVWPRERAPEQVTGPA